MQDFPHEFASGVRAIAALRGDTELAAQVAKRCNPLLKAFFQRLLAKGKSKMAATIAVAHKLLTILNAILRDKKPWQTA